MVCVAVMELWALQRRRQQLLSIERRHPDVIRHLVDAVTSSQNHGIFPGPAGLAA